MILRPVKFAIVGVAAALVVGALLLGPGVFSYIRTSARAMRTSVKDSVPVEFELRRARDMLNDVLPEMHANIEMIAQEEVEIAALKADIAESADRLAEQRRGIGHLRDTLAVRQTAYRVGDSRYTRTELTEDLSRRFERYKEAELVLEGKRRLLATRQVSLKKAIAMLDRTRGDKALLEQKIESLEAQHRLVQAAAQGSKLDVDHSKLNQADKLITDIKKRLDVAERVLAHEARFVEKIPVPTVDRTDLLTEIDEHFAAPDVAESDTEAPAEDADADADTDAPADRPVALIQSTGGAH